MNKGGGATDHDGNGQRLFRGRGLRRSVPACGLPRVRVEARSSTSRPSRVSDKPGAFPGAIRSMC